MTVAYKIVEVVDGQIKTLFHGIDGSRLMPRGKWIDADETWVRDGSKGTYYLSGWHVFLTLVDATEYLFRFRKRTDILQIVQCKVEGLTPKLHSPAPVLLARRIMF